MFETVEKVSDDVFRRRFVDRFSPSPGSAGDPRSRLIKLDKVLDSQRGRRGLVESRNLMQHIDRLLFLPFADEELWRFVKPEDKVSEEEDEEGHGA